jgi:long-subunit fatty acid transport protein
MNRIAPGAVALLLSSTSMASALGLDRSGQDITSIFETGNYAELSFGFASPTLEGTDLLGNEIEDVGEDFTVLSGSLTYAVTPQFSLGLIVDQPYGADISYGGSPAATLLGGTAANLDSTGFTLLGRYRINDSFSVHGGLRHVRSDAEVTLSGLAYGPLNGYNVELSGGQGTGYVLGAAYERPDIALRLALTYQSEIELEFDTVESGPALPGPVASSTTIVAPESWNLDFQTGIAADTLLFGQVRYAAYGDTILSPTFFGTATGGGSITDLDDGFSYTLGVGRRLSDRLSGSLAVTYEPEQDDDLVSPLAPVNGQVSVQLGTQYALTERLTLSGGLRYTWLGDARPETGTPDTARAEFAGNEAVSVALQIGYRF